MFGARNRLDPPHQLNDFTPHPPKKSMGKMVNFDAGIGGVKF